MVRAQEALPSEYQAAVYKMLLGHGGEAEFESILALHNKLESDDEKKQCMLGLGAAPTEELRTRALEFAMDTDKNVKLQDFFYVALSTAGAGLAAQTTCWNFFTANFARYQAKDMGASLMDAVVQGACAHFASTETAAAVEGFFAEHPLPRNTRKIEQILEGVATKAKALEALEGSDALAWLEAAAAAAQAAA